MWAASGFLFIINAQHAIKKVIHDNFLVLKTGLEKTQVLLKKPAGRVNAGFITGFSGKTGFLTENVHFWGSISVTSHL
jgi:hypothetical protein